MGILIAIVTALALACVTFIVVDIISARYARAAAAVAFCLALLAELGVLR